MKLLADFKYLLLRKARLLAKAIITSLLVCVLLQTCLVSAQAAEKFCSDYNGVIDGLVDPAPTQITIDRDCTFQNYPASNPLTSTLNFQTNDPSIYLIVFNNVIFTGHMACANVEHRIWFANGSDYGSNNNCQDLFIPVESIDKQAPAPTASIGEPFTYTLTFPSMTVVGGPSLNDLHSVVFWDDLTATGADLRFVGINAYYESSGIPVALRRETNPLAPGGRWTPTNLSYKLFDNDAEFIPAGEQVVVEVTVVPLDSTTNLAGTTFINTAKWSFGRLIDDVYYEPLPGEWGISAPMTIVEPELLVTKSSNETALNLGVPATYTIDVHNAGGGTAWNVTLEDQLPREMCDVDPTMGPAFSASIIDADGALVADLLPGDDFSAVFDGSPRCSLQLTMLSGRAKIAHDQHLVISYQSQLDADVTTDGLILVNVAGATEWFSTDPGSSETRTYSKRLTDGTPSILDHEDNQVITTALSGYYFQKTVANLTSGVNPATTALPGDRLRYRLRLFNVDETINAISINDTLDLDHFNPGSFSMLSLPTGATYSFNQSTGELSVTGSPDQLNVAVGEEIIIEFEVTLVSPLDNGTRVENQATLTAAGINALSDDPYVNGIAPPDGNPPPDPTTIVVESPGALIKTSNRTSATIGEQFSYTITIPETTLGVPMYDVRIVDNLPASDADMRFVQADVVSNHSWTLTNTSTDSAPVIEDTITGIDIPAGEQAVIEITVVLENSLTNQAGQTFNNSADYSFNRLNGVESTRTTGGSGFSGDMIVTEPHISSITKNADNPTPTAGEVVRYSVALAASGGVDASDVFDVGLIDRLGLGLVYVGNPSVTTGSGVSSDNIISEPIVTGDGSTSPQVLVWAPFENNVDIDIAEDEVITVSYDVRVLDSVLANQVLANSVVAQWTGLDGSNPGERDGSDGIGGLNDYITPEALATIATPDISATLDKSRLSDTFGPGDANVRIGDLVEYELRLSVAEGTLGNLELVDTLPRGLEYAGIISINGNTGPAPYAAVAPFYHADFTPSDVTVAGDPAAGPTTVTWAFGNVTNLPDNGVNDDFVLVYRAQVLDEVFALNDLNIPLNNTVTMTYDTATDSVTQSDGDTVITALQPQLAVSKSSDPAGGSSIAAGGTVTYTVDVLNSGNAPAYDAVIQDVLPVGLRQGGVTTTSITLVTAGATLPVLAPTYDPATGTVTWDFDTGTADAYTIPAGETLRLVYTVQADATLGPGLELTNTALATTYYSFDDEAVPANASVDHREQYGPSDPDSTTLYTGTLPIKTLVSPVIPEATIGQDIIYQITVPGAPTNYSIYDVEITDPLDSNLEIVDVLVSGGVNVTDNSTSVPDVMIVSISEIPAGQQAVIELRTRVRNVQSTQQGIAVDNGVSYTYANAPGETTQPVVSSPGVVTVNIVEPHAEVITKSADNPTPTAGEVVRYSVALAASGGVDASDVFDVGLIDRLGLGLVYVGNPSVTTGSGVSSDNIISEPIVTGDGSTSPQVLVWAPFENNVDIDIAEDEVITVSYDVRVLDSVLANQVLANSVVAQWTGLDGSNPGERDGSDGIGGLNDYITPEALATIATPDISATLDKSRLSDTFGPGDANVRIGDLVEYELRLSVAEGTLGNLELVDTLPRGLEYAGIISINGNTGPAPYAAVAPFYHADFTPSDVTVAGDPAAGPTTVTWAFGNVTNLPDNGVNDDFVLVYRAQVLDEVFALNDLNIPLNNTVTMTYDTATDSVTQSDGDTVITALQPQLAVSKSSDPAGGSSIAAGGTVTYTVDVLNSGNAPAYDAVIQDVLPVGLRQGGVTTTSITLVTAGATLPVLAPTYDPATGTVTWDFDTGTADAYTIPAGETLRLVYTVQADATLGPGLELTNTALATTYYSFDDEAVPANASVDHREQYGPSNIASTSLSTDPPVALQKDITQATVSIGELFIYHITVPSTPQPTALNDVRIIDDLGASAADISFVNVARIDGVLPWTPVNTGNAKYLVIEDVGTGIDIPADSQAIIEITVSLDNSSNNVNGLVFSNTADYTFNLVNDDPATETSGLPGTSGDMTISGPDSMKLMKSGPTTMRLGLPETFTIDVQNTGNAPAWDLTITDKLPDPSPGGMCESAPVNITAQIFASNGTDAISPVLVQDSDYTVSFAGSPDCALTVTMQSATAAISPGERLIVTYDAELDQDSTGGTSLTNVAAATEWFSGDTSGTGTTGSVRTYNGILSNGTVGTPDEQDAHTLLTETPVLIFRKSVVNKSTEQNPGANAEPGDTLQYTIRLENISSVDLPQFTLVDELDALNANPVFVPGSLQITSTLPPGAVDTTDANGGATGSGRLEIGNLTLDAAGGANHEMELRFEVTLADVLDSGTVVLNQAELFAYGVPLAVSDDPNVNRADDPAVSGDEDPTRTLISSAPLFEVWKTSDDVTGDSALLLAGDVLRYIITVKNVGNEHAINTFFQDQVPANTSYVDNSTTLNGNPVTDPAPGTSPLQSGLNIKAPDDSTPGRMRADSTDALGNVATITFTVQVDNDAVDGAVIANQGFVRADGAGSGPAPEEPSDDPDTVVQDDPTRDVVGSVPLIDAQKTVQLLNDATGIVDPGDVISYTIVISNAGAVPATGVVFIDLVPADTSYVEDTVSLNGQPVGRPDNGVSPLIAGIDISSSDLPLPMPGSGNGTLTPGKTAVITFDVEVNPGVAAGTIISNQGVVRSEEQPEEPTDADGNDANGDQPTETVVGNVEQLSLVKDVLVVGGGAVLPGSQLEYVLRATNIGSRPVTSLVLTDDLTPLASLASYVDGSASMDGTLTNVTYTGSMLSADYGITFGSLPVGESAVLRFRVQVETDVAIGATITNTGEASWDEPSRNTTASVSVVAGGSPGSISLNGTVWHDTNYDELADEAEQHLAGWTVELSRNGRVVDSALTDDGGDYRFTGVAPNAGTTEPYELRFIAPGAGPNTPSLGTAVSPLFTNGPQRIAEIFAASSETLSGLNLPVTPNGVVYNSVARTPVAGATLTLVSAANGIPLPTSCFDDPVQQNQVTTFGGYYKFDLNFNNTACQPGADYLIEVSSPSGYSAMPSQVIPPGSSTATAPFSVPACLGNPDDALPATTDICEVVASSELPPLSVGPGTQGTSYYMHLTLSNRVIPGDSQIFNNHLPIDPVLDGVVAISKTSPLINVTKGQLVPYTITVTNRYSAPLSDLSIIDTFPAGFKYVEGSGRIDGSVREPTVTGRQLTWDGIDLQVNEKHTLQLLLLVGSGVTEDEYVNQALIFNSAIGSQVSGIATATVRVIPDPTFDCTDIIGKVFDDRNLSGQQDPGEEGLPGVQVVTARGLTATTDQHGRFHITCAMVPDEDRGSNFILKLDDHTLPTGYRLTTENPRVQRVTRGKMMKFNFGATIHRVVSLDFANGVFEPEKTELRVQWHAKLRVLIEELKKAPSILRLSYLADVERESLVSDRLETLRDEIAQLWDLADGDYPLSVETEVFWRRGGPP